MNRNAVVPSAQTCLCRDDSPVATLRFPDTQDIGSFPKNSHAGNGRATAYGHHGEFLQGPINYGGVFKTVLVTVPDKRWFSSVIGKCVTSTTTQIITQPYKPKATMALTQLLDQQRVHGVRVQILFSHQIPESRGLGSSTADIVASLHCVDEILGFGLKEVDIARICCQIEGAEDPAMYSSPESLLFASRIPSIVAVFRGGIPAYQLATFDTTSDMGRIDTAKVRFSYTDEHVQLFARCITLYADAWSRSDLESLKLCASISATINQDFLPIPHWHELRRIIDTYGLGIQVAHTGSVIGLIGGNSETDALSSAVEEIRDRFGFEFTGYINEKGEQS